MKKPQNCLDFACGTGRVTAFIESMVKKSWGLDISDDMIEVAKERAPNTCFIVTDISHDNIDDLKGRFDLITAFRFFLNAEPELKKQIMDKLQKALKPSSALVFNIHQHYFSVNYFIEKIRRKIKKEPSLRNNWMSRKEISQLVEGAGMRITKIYSYAVLPRICFRFFAVKALVLVRKEACFKEVYLWFIFNSYL